MSAEGQVKKSEYMQRVTALMEEYSRIVLVTCDNIGSKHMQDIRKGLRGRAIMLLGKNTLMRKAIRMAKDTHPEWQGLLPEIKGNIGLVFTHEDLSDLQGKLLESRVPALAKVGLVAPQDVILPAQVTTLEPTKTNFFAALDIATKITRGCVEILADVQLCSEGKKVGSSEAALLQMLDMKPFTYGLKLVSCYDEGSVFSASLLKVTSAQILKAFSTGVANVAALSLGAGYPTLPAFPHVIAGGFRKCLAVALASDYTFKQAEAFQSRAAAATPAPAAAAPAAAAAAKPAEKPAPKPPSSSSEEEFGDIFG